MLTAKGYIRLKSGPDRDKLEHRVVLAKLCRERCYYPLEKDGLPKGMTVEHQDHRKTHNCYQNLILLQKEIHDHLSWCSMKKLEVA